MVLVSACNAADPGPSPTPSPVIGAGGAGGQTGGGGGNQGGPGGGSGSSGGAGGGQQGGGGGAGGGGGNTVTRTWSETVTNPLGTVHQEYRASVHVAFGQEEAGSWVLTGTADITSAFTNEVTEQLQDITGVDRLDSRRMMVDAPIALELAHAGGEDFHAMSRTRQSARRGPTLRFGSAGNIIAVPGNDPSEDRLTRRRRDPNGFGMRKERRMRADLRRQRTRRRGRGQTQPASNEAPDLADRATWQSQAPANERGLPPAGLSLPARHRQSLRKAKVLRILRILTKLPLKQCPYIDAFIAHGHHAVRAPPTRNAGSRLGCASLTNSSHNQACQNGQVGQSHRPMLRAQCLKPRVPQNPRPESPHAAIDAGV